MKYEAGEQYDAYYFAHNCGQPYRRDEKWLSLFDRIAECIVRDFQPKTVMDAGCAMGFLVEKLRERGVEAYGVDISKYAIEHVHESVRRFCRLASVTTSFPSHYDLIVSIEVLEHLSPLHAREAIANFCRHSDQVLFSSTPIDYQEVTHINVHLPDYWAKLFAGHGFIRDVDYDASFITPWAGLYRKMDPLLPDLVQKFERRWWELQQENAELRKAAQSHGASAKLAEQEMARLRARVAELEKKIEAFEQGRVMRFLLTLQRWREKLI
ncbi:MAG: class I SAM-dependent methyltransferase [Anaerolineae bacterium]